MQTMQEQYASWSRPVLVSLGRVAIATLMAAVLSVVGMGVASALSVFFGVSGLGTLLALLMIGAGAGAGLGSAIILFRVDAIPGWPLLLAILLGLSLVGLAGAWGGFKIGGAVTAMEEARCVGVCEYLFKPRTYMALGAIAAAVVAASAVRTGRSIREQSRRATVRTETGGSPLNPV